MNDVNSISNDNNDFILNTGSPHFIRFIDNVENFPVYEEGFAVRYSETYKKEGINVNFVQISGDRKLYVRTYERGVEAETLSCGTGVTAAALAFAVKNELLGEQTIGIQTPGGQLQVRFNRTGESTFEQIYLIGPAVSVFEGIYNA
jgi:diaminopimelate epimerase